MPPPPTRRMSVGAKFGGIIALCSLVVMALRVAIVSWRLRLQDDVQSEAIAHDTAKYLSLADEPEVSLIRG